MRTFVVLCSGLYQIGTPFEAARCFCVGTYTDEYQARIVRDTYDVGPGWGTHAIWFEAIVHDEIPRPGHWSIPTPDSTARVEDTFQLKLQIRRLEIIAKEHRKLEKEQQDRIAEGTQKEPNRFLKGIKEMLKRVKHNHSA